MISTELQNLVRIGQIKPEEPDRAEFVGLVESGRKRLKDARTPSLSSESQFDLAYNAAHALCLAALRWHGYRAANRFVVFQAVQHTLGMSAASVRVLGRCHQLRNATEYEGHAPITTALLGDLLAAADQLLAAIDSLGPPGAVSHPSG